MKIITAYNAKGGVWKTSIIHNLAYALSRNNKVLMIDLDQQSSLSISCNAMKSKYTSYNLLTDEKTVIKPVQLSENVYLIPADLQLSMLDKVLMQLKKPHIVLDKRLSYITEFDYILIDTPPALSLISMNAIYTADILITPVDCSYLSFMGLKTVEDTVSKLGKKINGIVATRYNSRTTDCRSVVELLEKKYNVIGKISESVKAKEALYYGLPIVVHLPNHKISEQYKELAESIRRL